VFLHFKILNMPMTNSGYDFRFVDLFRYTNPEHTILFGIKHWCCGMSETPTPALPITTNNIYPVIYGNVRRCKVCQAIEKHTIFTHCTLSFFLFSAGAVFFAKRALSNNGFITLFDKQNIFCL